MCVCVCVCVCVHIHIPAKEVLWSMALVGMRLWQDVVWYQLTTGLSLLGPINRLSCYDSSCMASWPYCCMCIVLYSVKCALYKEQWCDLHKLLGQLLIAMGYS